MRPRVNAVQPLPSAAARQGQAYAAKAESKMSSPSCSRSSPMTSGGRKRRTLPKVPAVSVTRPCWWQALEIAAVSAG